MACILLQTGAEDARFECARKMTELESRKRYEFLEAMVSSMDAHLRFFERGHEVTPGTRRQLTVLIYCSNEACAHHAIAWALWARMLLCVWISEHTSMSVSEGNAWLFD